MVQSNKVHYTKCIQEKSFQVKTIIVLFITILISCKESAKTYPELLKELIYIPEIHDDYDIYKADSLAFFGEDSLAKTTFQNTIKSTDINNKKLVYAKSKLLNLELDTSAKEGLLRQIKSINSVHILTYIEISKFELSQQKTISYLPELKKILSSHYPDYYKGVSSSLIAKYYDERLDNIDSAWYYLMTAEKYFKKTKIISSLHQKLLETITSFCTYKRKNLLAIRYANSLFDFEKYYPHADSADIAQAYANRAFMMFREGDMDGTIEDIELGLSYINPLKNPKEYQHLMKSYLVVYMISSNDSLWQLTVDKVIENIQKVGQDYIDLDRWFGQYYTQMSKYKEAIPYLIKAFQKEINSGLRNSAKYSTLCFLLSQCYEELGDFENALTYMAKNVGFKSYDDKTMIKHILTSTGYSFVTSLRCANIYFSQYNHTQKIASLLHSKKYLDVLDEVMFGQFKVAEENAILQFYLESGQEFFHLGMDVNYELWKKTGDQQYLVSFTNYSDKNKNSLMYRDIQMAQNLTALPPDIIQKEFNLRAAIKEEKRKGLKGNKTFDRIIDEYVVLEEEMESKYQTFITSGLIKDSLNLINVQQDIVDKETCILIIDETQEYWYYTIISRMGIILERQQITQDKILSIDTLLSSIQKEQIPQKMKSELLPKIIYASLYKKIMYIPDGIYHRFPLSALLEKDKHNIKHLPNIRLYKKFSTQVKSTKRSAFFAFSDPETIKATYRTRLAELPGTYKEVKRLSNQYPNVTTYSGKNATKANFINAYQDTNIQYIHLALHGLANSGEKDDVKLFFRTSTGGLDSLYGYELLKYKSKCQKIVLSACQSGLGTYEKGEGLFSLPRYFMINGATDVVFNYWDVED